MRVYNSILLGMVKAAAQGTNLVQRINTHTHTQPQQLESALGWYKYAELKALKVTILLKSKCKGKKEQCLCDEVEKWLLQKENRNSLKYNIENKNLHGYNYSHLSIKYMY